MIAYREVSTIKTFISVMLMTIGIPVFAELLYQKQQANPVVFESAPSLQSHEKITVWVNHSLVKALGLDGANHLIANQEIVYLKTKKVVSVSQTFKGLRVVDYQSRLILNQADQPEKLLGFHSALPDSLSHIPQVPLEAVFDKHQVLTSRDFHHELVFIADINESFHLAYEVQGYFAEGSHNDVWQTRYIDANSNALIRLLSHTKTARNRRVNDFSKACDYVLNTSEKTSISISELEEIASARFSRGEDDPPTNFAEVDSGFELLGNVYEFMRSVLDLNSLDGSGMALNMFVNVGFDSEKAFPIQCEDDDFNAAWSSVSQSVYLPSNGIELPEIVMHEFAHGIVANGSKLDYIHQPGALDESIADSIGVAFRIWLEDTEKNGSVPAVGKDAWQIRMPDGTVLRDLGDPASVTNESIRHPDHMDKYVYWPATEDYDFGAVHLNSSILSLAFYLMAEGGYHPRIRQEEAIEGIGVYAAAQIVAQAASKLLTTRANFEDARYMFAESAEAIHGKYSKQWIAVHMAMDAVGVSGYWPKPAFANPEKQDNSSERDLPTVSKPEQQSDWQNALAEDLTVVYLLIFGGLGLCVCAFMIRRTRPGGNDEGYQAHQADRTRTGNGDLPKKLTTVKPRPSLNSHWLFQSSKDDQKLFLSDGLLAGREGLVIGRSNDLVHIPLEGKRISRRHLRLRTEAGKLYLQDLNSTFGTYVDGKKIVPFKSLHIRVGQFIRIANCKYVLKKV